MNASGAPAWDQETTLLLARAQVRRRVDEQAADRRTSAHWVGGRDEAVELESIGKLGQDAVVGAELVLWQWSAGGIEQLSESLRKCNGLLVFVEPTAGLGWRRVIQLLGRRYRRDMPAALRNAGFSVTTQVRLWHGVHGTYVRGEARHFG